MFLFSGYIHSSWCQLWNWCQLLAIGRLPHPRQPNPWRPWWWLLWHLCLFCIVSIHIHELFWINWKFELFSFLFVPHFNMTLVPNWCSFQYFTEMLSGHTQYPIIHILDMYASMDVTGFIYITSSLKTWYPQGGEFIGNLVDCVSPYPSCMNGCS